MRAPVLLPAWLIGLAAERFFLSIADGSDPAGINAPPFAQCQVVFICPPLIGMSFDDNPHLRIFLKPRGIFIQETACIRADKIFVKIKEDISESCRRFYVPCNHFCFSD